MTYQAELIGTEGYIAAQVSPELWEARRFGDTKWSQVSAWQHWDCSKMTNSHTRWRRVAEEASVVEQSAVVDIVAKMAPKEVPSQTDPGTITWQQAKEWFNSSTESVFTELDNLRAAYDEAMNINARQCVEIADLQEQSRVISSDCHALSNSNHSLSLQLDESRADNATLRDAAKLAASEVSRYIEVNRYSPNSTEALYPIVNARNWLESAMNRTRQS